jgi:murein DD-endopeptidase MepM/ murein hydrolase activator NlpD
MPFAQPAARAGTGRRGVIAAGHRVEFETLLWRRPAVERRRLPAAHTAPPPTHSPAKLPRVLPADSLQAAFFEYKGKIIYAFPFEQNQGSGSVDYYDEEGKTLKNFFLKTPIKFSHITSRFTSNRFHPVQQIWKAHKGTDYAAPHGTPISSTAAGTVEQTGYTAGNGNFVKVKHNKVYSTQYLHMSRILVRRGQHVNQGQTIGLVGSTGLASGPHVCYRFWKNGVQVDALRLKLPNGEPMNPKNKERFLNKIEPLKFELDSVSNL